MNIKPLLFLCLALLLFFPVQGQKRDMWAGIDEDCYYLNLNKGWKSPQGSTDLPLLPSFTPKKGRSYTLQKQFFLPDSLPDSLYLWVGRYAWELEVILNEKYLTLEREPFQDVFLYVEKAWLRTGENRLSLRLTFLEGFTHSPRPVLGIWDGIGLIEARDLENFYLPKLKPSPPRPPKVALLAPYYGDSAYTFDEFEAARILLPLVNQKIRDVYFWFEPDRRLLAMCQKMGLRRTKEIPQGQTVAAINAYPFDPVYHGRPHRFWLDPQGKRNTYYGEFETWEDKKVRSQELSSVDENWLILLALSSFLSLALIKLISPAYFATFASLWMGKTTRNDISGENINSSTLLNLILNLIRLVGQTSWLALGLYFLQHQNLWYLSRQLFSSESLFASVFSGKESLSAFLYKVAVILLIWQGVKLLAWSTLGRIFMKKQMAARSFSLEVRSDLPPMLFLALPWIIGLYAIDEGGRILVIAMIILSALYALRKLIILFSELGRIFNFSTGMKILYICSLNVLPYLIWL